MTIITSRIIQKRSFIQLQTMFVENILVPWIQVNVHIVAQLSRTDMCNKRSQKKEDMFIARDEIKNILGCCDYSILCYFITKYPSFIRDFGKWNYIYSVLK